MGRGATKAAGNVWYEARINAAKWNDKLSSREGASEKLGVCIDTINNAERGLYKCMPVDVAVIMADEYKAPHLLNYYCLHECPIGCRQSISDEVCDLDRLTVKLMKNLRVSELESIKESLLDIAEDGKISEEEKPELRRILEYLDGVAKLVSELKILGATALHED